MLIIGRTIAGLAASGLMTGALTILSSCVPKERQPGEPLLISTIAMDYVLTDFPQV